MDKPKIQKNIFSESEIETATQMLDMIIDASTNLSVQDGHEQIFPFDIIEHETITNKTWVGNHAPNLSMLSCELKECVIDSSNLKYGNFSGSYLSICANSSSFDYSDFSNSIFNESDFEGCSFSDSFFCNSRINTCNFHNVEFTNTYFMNTIFIDIDFTDVSMTHARFVGCKFEKCTFPYLKSLQIDEGLDQIINSGVIFQNENRTHTAENDIYLNEVTILLPKLYKDNDYTSLIPFIIMGGDIQQSFNIMCEAIVYYCNIHDFRSVYYLCRIASENSLFTNQQLHQIFQQLESVITLETLSFVERYRYIDMLTDAKFFLIDKEGASASMSIILQTRICHTETEKLAAIQDILFKVTKDVDKGITSNITVRHNSPLNFAIELFGNPLSLIAVFSCLAFIFKESTTAIEKVQTIIIKHQDIQLKDIEIKLKRKELEKIVSEHKNQILLPTDFSSISYRMMDASPIFPPSLLEMR